jgi:hypothetical protein
VARLLRALNDKVGEQKNEKISDCGFLLAGISIGCTPSRLDNIVNGHANSRLTRKSIVKIGKIEVGRGLEKDGSTLLSNQQVDAPKRDIGEAKIQLQGWR